MSQSKKKRFREYSPAQRLVLAGLSRRVPGTGRRGGAGHPPPALPGGAWQQAAVAPREHERAWRGGLLSLGPPAAISLHACSCNNALMGHGVEPDLAFLSAQTARSVAETMQALATPSRVRILSRLAMGACSVGELAREVEMEQSAVSSSCACCATSAWLSGSATAGR